MFLGVYILKSESLNPNIMNMLEVGYLEQRNKDANVTIKYCNYMSINILIRLGEIRTVKQIPSIIDISDIAVILTLLSYFSYHSFQWV